MFSKRTGRIGRTTKCLVLAGLAIPAAAVATGPYPYELDGRMTGGGSIFPTENLRVTHGFELHCDVNDKPNRLQVNWEGNRFHLEELTSAQCSDDPTINPLPRQAPFDTYRGTGTGRYNGKDGARIDFKLTDAGEPGRRDRARFEIRDASGKRVLHGTAAKRLTFGNHQAHPNNK